MANRMRRTCLMKPLGLPLSIVLAAALVGLPLPGEAQGQPSARVDDGAYRGYVAVRVLGEGRHEVIDELNADRLFVPASVLKVLTVAAALEHLGAEYQWLTRLTSTGSITDGILEGDLVIESGADPTWGDDHVAGGATQPLAALARQIRDRGVTRVSGDLVVDASRFPGRPHPTDRSYGDLPYRHGTPPAGLAINEGTITVRVAPGPSVGEPASVSAPGGVEVINHTTTVGRERHGAGTLDFIPIWGTNILLLRGEYPISEAPFVVSASDPAPELRVARRLHEALGEAGVTVSGTVLMQSQAAGARDQLVELAELRSRPMKDVLKRILTESHNWYADMLTLTLAREVAGSGRFEDGVEVIADFVTGLLPDETPPASLWIQDGSGLSPSNLVTPTTVVHVLTRALGQPWSETLVEALATPGAGTLAAWPRVPPIAAKTGTLRHTVALAGILDPEGPDPPVVFCYFVNHLPERRGAARAEIASALGRWRTVSASR